jgi:hypothetical protein
VADTPAPVRALIEALPRSASWNGVRAEAQDGQFVIKRKPAGTTDPLLDLWLGERLADALSA